MERQFLRALVAKKLDSVVNGFVAEHRSAIEKLDMNPEQLKELLWELVDEAVKLRQQHKSVSAS